MWLGTSFITTIVGAIVIISGAALDCFSWGLLYRISELFQIVAMRIRCLDEFKETEKFHVELTNLIDVQELANRSARKMENFLSELVLYLFGVCICVLCAIMLVLSMSNVDHQLLLSMGIALWYVLFQLFSYSMLGTALITASTSVAEAIYETKWYERINSEQRNILFVLMRSQKMVPLTVGKSLTVHRATFGAVLRSAFSYYSVLRQLYNE
ncbi:odorant receptor Or2 [Culex quinquefasciatus]|uniref:odorant receptor Or2 n=1 Tax=Culex quinquefasciatus TaxID=7176 RepID=UPI0018E37366|nr:odorant receptor Or2 [Culex quinquefasciatus]